jgi:predicted house-cleaning noncanonical NTP pyrophosphatase (MazG superfamily)
LLNDISNADSNVKAYLKAQCRKLLENKDLTEGIESVLTYESLDEGADIIEQLIREIAEINNENL